jgi:hypothetical protein
MAAPIAYEDSLLFALSKTTALDFDGNDSLQIQLYSPGTFLDVTSNQVSCCCCRSAPPRSFA